MKTDPEAGCPAHDRPTPGCGDCRLKLDADIARLMAMPEAEVDAELRAMGIDPKKAAEQGRRAVEGALATIQARKSRALLREAAAFAEEVKNRRNVRLYAQDLAVRAESLLSELRTHGVPVAHAHHWCDFGSLGGRNVVWCSGCDSLAFTGQEPDGVTVADHKPISPSATDDDKPL